MENIILKASKHNCGMLRPGIWTSAEWTVYEDLKVEVKYAYNTDVEENETSLNTKTIPMRKLKKIFRWLEKAKKENRVIKAYDGTMWEITRYNNDGSENFKKERGYIYGIKSLEKVTKLLEELK